MTALGFKGQFVEKVRSREKKQSIRKSAHNHKVGRPIQLYENFRSKYARKIIIDDPICTSIEPIVIDATFGIFLGEFGDRDILTAHQEIQLAKADGFESYAAFILFFLGTQRGNPFYGHLIKWDWPK